MVGVVTGLAWTEVGGEILTIESVMLPGKGNVKHTGKLGDVMQESVSAALSYVRSRAISFGIKPTLFEKRDIHVHVPEGATPKDGPSAGMAMATSIVSVLTGIPVRRDVAMTGEITLRGRVLPIGGLKEKLLAALRAGITTVFIPKDNEKDLAEIPDSVKKIHQAHAGLACGRRDHRRRWCASRSRSSGRSRRNRRSPRRPRNRRRFTAALRRRGLSGSAAFATGGGEGFCAAGHPAHRFATGNGRLAQR